MWNRRFLLTCNAVLPYPRISASGMQPHPTNRSLEFAFGLGRLRGFQLCLTVLLVLRRLAPSRCVRIALGKKLRQSSDTPSTVRLTSDLRRNPRPALHHIKHGAFLP